MPEPKLVDQRNSPIPAVDKVSDSSEQPAPVWPSAATSGGGAYIPSPRISKPADAKSE